MNIISIYPLIRCTTPCGCILDSSSFTVVHSLLGDSWVIIAFSKVAKTSYLLPVLQFYQKDNDDAYSWKCMALDVISVINWDHILYHEYYDGDSQAYHVCKYFCQHQNPDSLAYNT